MTSQTIHACKIPTIFLFYLANKSVNDPYGYASTSKNFRGTPLR
jgi:hypothetical protein